MCAWFCRLTYDHQFINKRMLALGKLVPQRESSRLTSQKFSFRRFQRLFAIQAKYLLLLLAQGEKKRLFSQGGDKVAN